MTTEPSPALGSPRSGAQYALQVALQTMKERCQQLQGRLSTIEDENIALRRIVARSGLEDMTLSGPAGLREQVAVLSLQKSQLSRQMQMVAEENRKLWGRLSGLYEANQSLGKHLARISDTLRQHPSTPTQDSEDASSGLKEISLRLENSMKQERLELEQQLAEMAEMQISSPIDLQTLAAEGDEYEKISDHYNQLIELRDMLKNQQNELRAGVEAVSNLPHKKQQQQPQVKDVEEERQMISLQEWGTPTPSSPDWTCPMCGRHFSPATMDFESFQHHVTSHFVSEDDPTDSIDFCD